MNASGALKIVGECYPFDESSALLLLADNHNSVNGIREFCLRKKGRIEYCPIQYEDLRINREYLRKKLAEYGNCTNKLFGFPAQSNVSGVRHDLSWIAEAQAVGWDVLLDAAAYVPTSRLDLSVVKPDFVSVSFYKIFGYPTGIGCLLVKKSAYPKLKKTWFAGGTVTLAAVQSHHHFLADSHERFEDGTINYLGLPAIAIGLDYINSIGIDRIHERVEGLRKYLCRQLQAIRHDSGRRVVKIFGPEDHSDSGGTMIMNFFDEDGNPYPFELIEQMTNRRNISIRSGCFCNPGIDEVNSCLTTEELARYFSSREKGNFHDMVNFLHKMRGATRVSMGLATTRRDLDEFIAFARDLRNHKIEEG
jgi:selenocysteine lyase/cysteine desulfurase